ncbi:hypothetical protein NL676_012135 [Syzygium grande]|nr:hypothetical protein NL676_012135 [Syzygium grande]
MSFSSSTASRVFRGCRALLSPAKPAAAAAAPDAVPAARSSKAAAAAKPKPRPKKAASGGERRRRRGLAEGAEPAAVKQIWAYIKKEGLQDSINKREINCDERLKTLFEGREKVGFLEIGVVSNCCGYLWL